MIVKDEEANMPQVLESLQGVVDDVVVVDTGSTDNTPAICGLYGAHVYHHPWQRNFSLHRNQSLQYAQDIGADWCLVIDADERLVKSPHYTKEGFVTWLTTEVDNPGYKAVAVVINDYQSGKCAMNCNSARMFKAGTVQYRNMVHNQPEFEGACILNHFFSFTHHGYDLTREQMRKKFFRTKGLLFKEMHENPDNHDTSFYLCQLYGHHGFTEKSRYWGERYLSLKDEIQPERFNSTIYYTMIRNYQESGMLTEAEALLRSAMVERPFDPDLASAMSDHGALTRNNALMAEGARRYITGFRDYTENPAKKGGNFFFSLNDETLTLNLYRLTIASLEEGMRCFQAVKPRVPTMSPTLKEEFKMNMQVVGLPQLLQDVSELETTQQCSTIDVRGVQI